VNPWLIAAFALFPGFILCGATLWRAGLVDAIVALDLAGVLAALEIMLLAEGVNQSSFYTLALVLAVLSLGGSFVFARFLGRWI
jgi:multisubunit Na+/H+ antiporter MnhF subunit